MPAGFYVTNDAGTFQIDDTYQNYHLVEKGTSTTNAAPTWGSGRKRDIAYAGIDPLIAIRCDQYAYVSKIAKSGADTIFSVNVYGPNGSAFDYYIFDVLDTTEAGDGGLVIRDGAGKITFDAGRYPLLIEDVVDQSVSTSQPPNGASDETDHTYDPGSEYAVIIGLLAHKVFFFFSGGNPSIRYSTSAWKAITGGVRSCEYGSTWVQAGGGPAYINQQASGLIVDVTHL